MHETETFLKGTDNKRMFFINNAAGEVEMHAIVNVLFSCERFFSSLTLN